MPVFLKMLPTGRSRQGRQTVGVTRWAEKVARAALVRDPPVRDLEEHRHVELRVSQAHLEEERGLRNLDREEQARRNEEPVPFVHALARRREH